MPSTDSDLDDFDLADFIDDCSELFVVMGVFGALAIYISRATGDLGTSTNSQLMTTVGFVSAFSLAILTYGLIYKELAKEFDGWIELFRAHYHKSNAPLALFSLFSLVLLISISHILTRHEPVVFMLVLTAVYASGVGVVLRLTYGVARRVPRTPVWRISTVFTACLAAFLGTMYVRDTVLTQIEVTTIYELSYSNPVTVVITAAYLLVLTIQSFAALGVLATIVGIPFVAFDKIRGKSPYDRA